MDYQTTSCSLRRNQRRHCWDAETRQRAAPVRTSYAGLYHPWTISFVCRRNLAPRVLGAGGPAWLRPASSGLDMTRNLSPAFRKYLKNYSIQTDALINSCPRSSSREPHAIIVSFLRVQTAPACAAIKITSAQVRGPSITGTENHPISPPKVWAPAHGRADSNGPRTIDLLLRSSLREDCTPQLSRN